MTTQIGLSPLARGTLIVVNGCPRVSRFIPAGAVNTFRTARKIMQKPVYPRWRGEHAILHFPNYSMHGLSPLARGTRLL